jgi:hypothetical protein
MNILRHHQPTSMYSLDLVVLCHSQIPTRVKKNLMKTNCWLMMSQDVPLLFDAAVPLFHKMTQRHFPPALMGTVRGSYVSSSWLLCLLEDSVEQLCQASLCSSSPSTSKTASGSHCKTFAYTPSPPCHLIEESTTPLKILLMINEASSLPWVSPRSFPCRSHHPTTSSR